MKLTMGRTCGQCTACCKALGVREIAKPPGMWCQHCSIGEGCVIYARKPLSCHEFQCEWLKGFGEVRDRPDKTKVILDYVNHHEGLPEGILQIWELDEGSLANEYVKKMTLAVLGSGIWVSHIPLHGHIKRIFVPRSRRVSQEIAEALAQEEITVADWP